MKILIYKIIYYILMLIITVLLFCSAGCSKEIIEEDTICRMTDNRMVEVESISFSFSPDVIKVKVKYENGILEILKIDQNVKIMISDKIRPEDKKARFIRIYKGYMGQNTKILQRIEILPIETEED